MYQEELEIIDIKNWVTKSNELIESTYKLSLQEQRILLVLASKVEPNDDILKTYRFRARDFIEIVGNKKGTGFYSYLKETVIGLQRKVLTIRKDGKEVNYNWVITSEYEENEGYIILQFHPKLKDFFLQLRNRFTTYQLENVIQLNSVYSIRIYELLKQDEFKKKRSFTIKQLKEHLGIEETKYKQYGHFKDRVINIAYKEINEKTDINVTFEEIKKGRKIEGIVFFIQSKRKASHMVESQNKAQYGDSSDQLNLDTELEKEELVYRLKQLKVHMNKINYIMETFPLEQIKRNVDYCEPRKNSISSIGGYTYKAITLDYASSESQQPTENEEEVIDKTILFHLSGYWRSTKEKHPYWFVDEMSVEEIQKHFKLDEHKAQKEYQKVRDELFKALDIEIPSRIAPSDMEEKKKKVESLLRKYKK